MTNSPKIAVYALTGQGLKLAQHLAIDLGGTVYALHRLAEGAVKSFESLPSLIESTFTEYDGHVFVAAAGIVVRSIAPYLVSKESDPAVVCLDQEGRFAVSLLSGHLGGANDLAIQCARSVGGQPVVTTATDSAGVLSMDMLAAARGLAIGNIDRIKIVNGALLDKRIVQVFDPDNRLGLAGNPRFSPVGRQGDWKKGAPGVWVSWRENCPDEDALRLHPRVLHLGVGCRRDVGVQEIMEHVQSVFETKGLALKSIASLGSVEAKRDEWGLLEAAAELNVTPVFYSTKQLGKVGVPSPSERVQVHMGVPSVAEASALLSSGGGVLIVDKEKTSTVTLAVARSQDA